jgi:hypothetical protein
VLVVVVAVRGVAVAVMDVVDVIVVLDGLVTAVRSVGVIVRCGHNVDVVDRAFVVVVVVRGVCMTVVEVVDVTVVFHDRVAAVRGVDMGVGVMGSTGGAHGGATSVGELGSCTGYGRRPVVLGTA